MRSLALTLQGVTTQHQELGLLYQSQQTVRPRAPARSMFVLTVTNGKLIPLSSGNYSTKKHAKQVCDSPLPLRCLGGGDPLNELII